MNPKLRPFGAGLNPLMDPESWGRWDVAGGRTIYAAETRTGSYIESLAWARKNALDDLQTDETFTEYEGATPYTDDEPTVMAQVEKEWQTSEKMIWGCIAADWRDGRNIYALDLPKTGWFIDIDTADTLSTISKALPQRLQSLGVARLDQSHIYGPDRALTTSIAHWLHGRILFDGSLPHGIVYQSKLGAEFECSAIWLRALDDGKTLRSEPTKVRGHQAISHRDPDLMRAASLLGLHLF